MPDLTNDPQLEVLARKVLGETLESPPPVINEATAIALVRCHYGIRAHVQILACERDANFHVKAETGLSFILKVSNSGEPLVNTNFQTEAILWLERVEHGLPVPKVVRALDGQSEFPVAMADGRTSIVRMLTWLDGVPVVQVGVSAALRRDMGRTLARLGAALQAFDHPGASHDIQWDIKNASRLRPLIASLPDNNLRGQLMAELDHFDQTVQPALAGLRQQVVHNDFNHHNILLNPKDPNLVSGILDFGDMVRTPLVADLAVAASYMTHQQDDALGCVLDMVAAYHAVTPLLRPEIFLLRDLIVARLITSIAITEWRASRYPQNADYILRNNGPARIGMAQFASLPREVVTQALFRACKME